MRAIFTPREPQKLGFAHMLNHGRCALWAGLGVGKTLTTLMYVDFLFSTGERSPVLVLAPKRVARDTWPDEVGRWENFKHLKVAAIVGSPAEREAALKSRAHIYTINYENLPWLVGKVPPHAWPWRTVIADESDRLKGHRVSFQEHHKTGTEFLRKSGKGGTRAKALADVAFTKVQRFVELTGTPSTNGLQDLWGQLWFLDKGHRLGTCFSHFTDRYFRYEGGTGYGRMGATLVPQEWAAPQIHAKVKDICLTLDPADFFDLTEPINVVVDVRLPARAQQHYDEMFKQLYTEVMANGPEGEARGIEAVNAGAKAIKCMQIANGFLFSSEDATEWADLHDAKIEALESIVGEAAGSPVLCAYHFKPDLARLKKAFPRAADLSTANGMAAFKAGDARLGLGHPGSMGHGVDGLQRVCSTIAFFGHWWDTGAREQMIGRVGPMRQFQIGNKKPIWIYDIAAKGTIDYRILDKHKRKLSTQEALLLACNEYRIGLGQ